MNETTDTPEKELPGQDKKNKPSRWLIFLAGLSFGIPVLLMYYYRDYYEGLFVLEGFEIRKMPSDSSNIPPGNSVKKKFDVNFLKNLFYKVSTIPNQIFISNDSLILSDSIILSDPKYEYVAENYPVNHLKKPYSIFIDDSSKHRVLLLGDSEAGGLCFPLNDYCVENGHKLIFTLAWNSSTILNYAYSDTILNILERFKPTYVFFVVGLNEIYARDIEKRKNASVEMARRLNGIPYAWIGPANWAEDFGINNAFKSGADSGTFFLSKDIKMPRGPDGRHPSTIGYRIWMDSIAEWIQTRAKHKITMQRPRKIGHPIKSQILNMNAVKFKGY